MGGKAHHHCTAYEAFEPFCRWDRNEDRDHIEIDLKDFKRNQLKVQISNCGILKISGECQSNALTKRKFCKEIPVPSNIYDTNAVREKFADGWLYITIPKHKTLVLEFNKCNRSPKCEFQLAKAAVASATAGVAAAAVMLLVACVLYMCKSAVCKVDG